MAERIAGSTCERGLTPSESGGAGLSRRDFMKSSAAGLVSGALAGSAAKAAPEQERPGGRILLKDGIVLTLDPRIGDFGRADVLIEGSRIVEVGPDIEAEASRVDATGAIVMPGFVDTHRHMWEGPLRNVLPDGRLADYGREITGAARSHYRPEDAYIGDLVSALGAIDAGVTTVLDWSHIGNSPEHTDAAIEGLREAGIRAVYAYGTGSPGPENRYPRDIFRLRERYFSSSDQLLTLAMATGLDRALWVIAREAGAPITTHVNATGALIPMKEAMGSDNTYIHCCNLADEEWRLIADTGGGVSIAGPVEMEMGHGVPPYQKAIDHAVPWSLSVDVETQMPGDLFTQMRTAFTLQRMLAFAQERASASSAPPLLTVREVVEVATRGGARVNHLEDRIGTLTPGKQADIIVLDVNRINALPVNDAYGAVVLSVDTSNVRDVFIAGKPVKRDGALVGVDLARIRRLAAASRDDLVARSGWPTLSERLARGSAGTGKLIESRARVGE